MRLVTYELWGDTRTGALHGDEIVDLNRAYRAAVQAQQDEAEASVADRRVPTEMIALLGGGDRAVEATRAALAFVDEQLKGGQRSTLTAAGILVSRAHVTLRPPVLYPGKVLCLGVNYRSHAAEVSHAAPDYPVLFHKTAGSLIGDGQAIVIPTVTEQVDYEGELAVIIGRRGRHIAREAALAHVAGYCPANDISARDLQGRTKQWTTGKMLDTFGPLGPALVTRDEVPDPNRLGIETVLNGEVMQQSNTANMIFDVPFIISYVSELVTLQPGDVILTGTPEGVGKARTPPVFLQPGDTISVSIEKVGTLQNPVVAAG